MHLVGLETRRHPGVLLERTSRVVVIGGRVARDEVDNGRIHLTHPIDVDKRRRRVGHTGRVHQCITTTLLTVNTSSRRRGRRRLLLLERRIDRRVHRSCVGFGQRVDQSRRRRSQWQHERIGAIERRIGTYNVTIVAKLFAGGRRGLLTDAGRVLQSLLYIDRLVVLVVCDGIVDSTDRNKG